MVKWNFNQITEKEKRVYKKYHRASNQSPYTRMVSAPRREYENRTITHQGKKNALHIPNPDQLEPIEVSLSDALLNRRTNWNFSKQDMNMDMLVTLLSFSFGITNQKDLKRSYPSGGQFYPIDIFVVPLKRLIQNGVLEEKVYQYNVDFNELVEEKDFDITSIREISGSTDIGFFHLRMHKCLYFSLPMTTLLKKSI